MTSIRVDRKYLLSRRTSEEVLAATQSHWMPDAVAHDLTQRYETDYFDTDDLHLFHAARRQRPQRSKIRVRHYINTGTAFIEVKSRNSRGETAKVRQAWTGEINDAHDFLLGALHGSAELVERLVPTSRTTYERTAASMVDGGRMTLDRKLLVGNHSFTHRLGDGSDDLIVLETKSAGQGPTAIDRHMWDQHIRPVALSKYALAVASFCPELPFGRWTSATSKLRPNS